MSRRLNLKQALKDAGVDPKEFLSDPNPPVIDDEVAREWEVASGILRRQPAAYPSMSRNCCGLYELQANGLSIYDVCWSMYFYPRVFLTTIPTQRAAIRILRRLRFREGPVSRRNNGQMGIVLWDMDRDTFKRNFGLR